MPRGSQSSPLAPSPKPLATAAGSAASIKIRGARQNNLKNLSFDLPLNEFIVVTGLSGSGKSSLAFDTLYAEGQRRYAETFSPYTRQFLERMDKPEADAIEGIPPAIALSQSNAVRTSRSTVGTMTEIAEHFKLLFPKRARLHSPETGQVIQSWDTDTIAAELLARQAGKAVLVLFEVPFPAKTGWPEIASFLQAQGYVRVLTSGGPQRLDQPPAKPPHELFTLREKKALGVPVIQDRLTVDAAGLPRLREALDRALELGKGTVLVTPGPLAEARSFHRRLIDPATGVEYPAPTASFFSFNNPVGACPACKGFGRVIKLDYDLALPDRTKSIWNGVVKPFQTESNAECQRDLVKACKRRGIDITASFASLPAKDRAFVLYGEHGKATEAEHAWKKGEWYGVKGFFDWLESRTYKMHVRILLSKYRAYLTCPDCGGHRFKPEVALWKLDGKTLPELNELPVSELLPFMEGVESKDESEAILLAQITSRLRFLQEAGLGYLHLNRATRTLSGGELQRVNLTTCLGTSLTGTLFVLDEPSIGLHPRDVEALIGVLHRLRNRGNTVLVVEHDAEVMRSAGHLLEIGPASGARGGQLVYEGKINGLLQAKHSLTGQYLSGAKQVAPDRPQRPKASRFLKFRGLAKNNLRGLDLDLPLGRFVAITGVSGSGKSTLAHEGIYKNLLRGLNRVVEEPAALQELKGLEAVEDVVLVDQTPLTLTPRSTPVLYLGIYDAVRSLMAGTEEAKSAGLGASAFSFNTGVGRCERCQGTGFEKITMQFLSDIYVKCPACEGKRFNKFVLEVPWRGKSIHDLLELTLDDAHAFFQGVLDTGEPTVVEKRQLETILHGLGLVREVGLGYLRMGQPLNQLSGGESQRLKLVSILRESLQRSGETAGSRSEPAGQPTSGQAAGRAQGTPKTTVLLLDEPTTGLHFDDVRVLLKVFQRLVDSGASLVVIEHHLDVIKSADHVIDLGPEAGAAGGKIIAQGSPEAIMAEKSSHTGRYLRLGLEASGQRLAAKSNQRGTAAKLMPLAPSPSPLALPPSPSIEIRGAKHHNLKDVTVTIPLNQMVVITGLSGSGKSTLAFDLVFSEGQRRYLDCLNTYARNFIEQMERPRVDAITGLPPTVAIEQRTTSGGAKSTVATITELYHFMRLLYAKLGVQHDPETGEAAAQQSADEVIARIEKQLRRGEHTLIAPLIRGRKGIYTELAEWAGKKGFPYLRVDGKWIEPAKFKALDRYKEHSIDLIVGNLSAKSPERSALIGQGLQLGKGTVHLLDNRGQETIFSTHLTCPSTGRSFEPLDPRMFSFNSSHGWCPECQGYGTVLEVETDAETEAEREAQIELAREYADESEAKPCPACRGARLNELARAVKFQGVAIPELNAMTLRDFRNFFKKLKLDARGARIARDIRPEIEQRLHFLGHVGLDYLTLDRPAPTLSGGEAQRIRLAAQLGSNLQGVLYVLDEPTIGLHPRDNEDLIAMLRQLQTKGNSLIIVEHDEDTMRASDYIIDMGPGAGVHGGQVIAQGPWKHIAKNEKSITGTLLGAPLKHPMHGQRRPVGKKDTDWIQIQGARANNLKNIDASLPRKRLTVLSGVSGAGKSTLLREVLHPAIAAKLAIRSKGQVPISKGEKKTSPYAKATGDKKPATHSPQPATPWTKVDGLDGITKVVEVDQLPIGKTSRSTVATYAGLMDCLRKLMASVPEAKLRGLTAGHFSYNHGAGRCPTCMGAGTVKIEMNFLPTVYVPCESCNGLRYTEQVLDIRFRGKNIAELLNLSLEEALEFFQGQPDLRGILDTLCACGLGYLTLGQTSPTLSGGEAQRLKLAYELGAAKNQEDRQKIRRGMNAGEFVYLLEEPTVGLHLADVQKLLEILHKLVDAGHSVIVIEHHLDVIAEADYLIEIGPNSGESGGRLVAHGTPEQVTKIKGSPTAPYLSKIL
jgi:excinuclease ABC subunit A